MHLKEYFLFFIVLKFGSIIVNGSKLNRDHYARLIFSESDIKEIKEPLQPENKPKSRNSETPLKVGILGAGISGLYSALILKSLGIDFEILEANKEHIGGRAFTFYFTDKNKKAKTCREYYDYAEMGPMRIPKHVTRLVGDESWSLVKYLRNSTLVKNKPKLIKFNYGDDNSLYYFNGKKIFNSDSQNDDPLSFSDSKNGGPGTGVPDYYAAKPFWEWIGYSIQPFLDLMATEPDLSFNFIKKYDNHSVRTFMSTFDGKQLRKEMGLSDYESPLNPSTNERLDKNYPQIAINWMETLDAGTGFYDHSLAETVIDANEFSSKDWVTIDGGISRLADAMGEAISLSKSNLHMGNRVIKISKSNKLVVTASISSLKGPAKTKTYTYDHVISTLPLGPLQTVDTKSLNFDLKKRIGMRMLTYMSSAKIALKFKTRWWQDPVKMNNKTIKGGQTWTDLPIRKIIYPSFGLDCPNAPGTILVSYTWGQDAIRLGSRISPKIPSQDRIMNEELLIEDVLNQLTLIHGPVVKKEYMNKYFAINWDNNPLSMGAFALYGPGQFSTLYRSMIKSEVNGYMHFAGEATSVHHGWILGALNSGYRAVMEILMKEGMTDKLNELKTKWGTVDELSYFE